jgi:hypothetical protein
MPDAGASRKRQISRLTNSEPSGDSRTPDRRFESSATFLLHARRKLVTERRPASGIFSLRICAAGFRMQPRLQSEFARRW